MIEHRYLYLPVCNSAPKRLARVFVDGASVTEFEIEWAEGQPDYLAFYDLAPYRGRALAIELDGAGVPSAAITLGDTVPDAQNLYCESYRPQFHFSSRRGWNNDPNGLVYYQGEYHLFYQHNPYGWKWGNMHWGHAISRDLVHWQELGDALYPDALGTMFSGSAVVDWGDTAGLQRGEEKALVCIYTAAGDTSALSKGQPFTQCIAASHDRGRSWRKYEGNPVLGHIAAANRDPKVIWHAPTRRWIMALYLDKNDYALFASPDMKAWARICDVVLPGCSECPDMFELPVDGNATNKRWVFWGANGTYRLGAFDGHAFTPEGEPQRYDWGGHTYAAQTWSDIPAEDGRRIQIAWFRKDLPGMPFNQFMSFPCELTLRNTPEGIRLHSEPVREIETLHTTAHKWRDLTLKPGENPLAGIEGEMFDIRAAFRPTGADAVALTVRGTPILYDALKGVLTCQDKVIPLEPLADGTVRLQVLVDRASLEIFCNGGRVALPLGILFSEQERSLELGARGGEVLLPLLSVYPLRSAWR
jgi:fructan beta-fructosidase